MTDAVYHTSESAQSLGYYAYVVVPPIQLILNAIAAHCGVGGTIRPGVRRLAAWADYASAGRISPMLDQLAQDGWIQYDPSTGLITLLEDPSAPITPRDRQAETEDESPAIADGDPPESAPITARDRWADSEAITRRDRDPEQQDASEQAITRRDRSAPRMEDHVLVAATESKHESAAARYKLPCSAETITERDRSADLVMAELGTNAKLRAKALAARPDLTPQQVLDTWAHFEPRIAAKRCDAGAFHAALANGEIHPAPPDPNRPLDPESYADDPAFTLGGQAPPGATFADRADRLLPKPTAATLKQHTADWLFLQRRMGDGDTDEQALAALEHRRATARGGP